MASGSTVSPSASEQPTKHGLFVEELIQADTLKSLMDKKTKLVILDARSKKSYDEAHIQGALLPLTKDYYEKEELFRVGILPAAPDRDKDLAEAMKQYPKNSKIVTYCNDDCQASSVLLLQIKRLGFSDVHALDEGFQTWESKGYPVTREKKLIDSSKIS